MNVCKKKNVMDRPEVNNLARSLKDLENARAKQNQI